MQLRVLACGSLVSLLVVPPASALAQDCPTAKPTLLTMAVTPVVGQSPAWLTWGKGPLAWLGPDKPLGILFVRDRAVRGPATLSGRQRASGAKVRFGKTGSTLGLREDRIQLDALGTKPRTATPKDLERYSFHMLDVWFPDSGCYEVTARVGSQQSVILVNVEKRRGK